MRGTPRAYQIPHYFNGLTLVGSNQGPMNTQPTLLYAGVQGRAPAYQGVSRRRRKGRGDRGLRRGYAETCETMLCRDDDNGGAACRLSEKISRKRSFAMFGFMAAIDQPETFSDCRLKVSSCGNSPFACHPAARPIAVVQLTWRVCRKLPFFHTQLWDPCGGVRQVRFSWRQKAAVYPLSAS